MKSFHVGYRFFIWSDAPCNYQLMKVVRTEDNGVKNFLNVRVKRIYLKIFHVRKTCFSLAPIQLIQKSKIAITEGIYFKSVHVWLTDFSSGLIQSAIDSNVVRRTESDLYSITPALPSLTLGRS